MWQGGRASMGTPWTCGLSAVFRESLIPPSIPLLPFLCKYTRISSSVSHAPTNVVGTVKRILTTVVWCFACFASYIYIYIFLIYEDATFPPFFLFFLLLFPSPARWLVPLFLGYQFFYFLIKLDDNLSWDSLARRYGTSERILISKLVDKFIKSVIKVRTLDT